MIEHVAIPVTDISKAKKFYQDALAPLGYEVRQEYPDAVGFMEGGHTSFWIGKHEKPQTTHIALRAGSKEVVDKFHDAAIKAGGKDNGKPGYRDYSPGYYAAFIHDADGNNVEAVWYDPSKEGVGRE